MDAAEYKHVVLGLIFLKYISDAFEEQARQARGQNARAAPTPKTPTSTRANVFWVPQEARWPLKPGPPAAPSASWSTMRWSPSSATTPRSRACCRRTMRRPALDKHAPRRAHRPDRHHRSAMQAAAPRTCSAASTNTSSRSSPCRRQEAAGEFYTPRCVVRAARRDDRALQGPRLRPLLRLRRHVRAVDEFIRAQAKGTATAARPGRHLDLRPGVEPHDLAARQDEPRDPRHRGQIAHGDTFHHDLHPDLKADFILANPPFNICDWGGERLRTTSAGSTARRRRQRQLRLGAAHHPPPGARRHRRLRAGERLDVVEPVRRGRDPQGHLIEADLVDCMVALPGQLFYTTQIPACLWFLPAKQERQVPRPPRRDAVHRRPQARHAWWTARTAS